MFGINLNVGLISRLFVVACYLLIVPALNGYAQQKPVAEIPFELDGASIILKVKINSYPRVLRLLFDTGADGMALSKSLADSIGLKITSQKQASVVGGSLEISISRGNSVFLDSFELKNQSIAVFENMSREADGIIGNRMAAQYITQVNFDSKKLSLYNFSDYEYPKEGAIIPFKYSGVFMLPGTLSVTPGKTYSGNFVFDTGANYELICFRPFVRQNRLLVDGFKPQSQGSTTSMGVTVPSFTGKAQSFSFSGLPEIKNLNVTLTGGGGAADQWNPNADGSIGIKMISQFNFSINVPKREIHLVPRKP
ncbi:retropepsin-like aspartic protease [Desertivirga arenae]|uniref:retropepsin-like aspartic protease n=1 Tax=Desertivirga arenae TaxID=2810309 RepID=UPI001A95E968|nr:retropepsin-like aspartic protease [Pedobacter sp. SYSU D00823]